MTALEIVLLVCGILCVIVSFLVGGKGEELQVSEDEKTAKELTQQDKERIRKQIEEILEEQIDDISEKTEAKLDKISNTKILEMNDYAETIMGEINRNHNETVFLYDMLNEKAKEVKSTVKDVNVAKKEMARLKYESTITVVDEKEGTQAGVSMIGSQAENGAQGPVKTVGSRQMEQVASAVSKSMAAGQNRSSKGYSASTSSKDLAKERLIELVRKSSERSKELQKAAQIKVEPLKPAPEAVKAVEPIKPTPEAVKAEEPSKAAPEAVKAEEPSKAAPEAVKADEVSKPAPEAAKAEEVSKPAPEAVKADAKQHKEAESEKEEAVKVENVQSKIAEAKPSQPSAVDEKKETDDIVAGTQNAIAAIEAIEAQEAAEKEKAVKKSAAKTAGKTTKAKTAKSELSKAEVQSKPSKEDVSSPQPKEEDSSPQPEEKAKSEQPKPKTTRKRTASPEGTKKQAGNGINIALDKGLSKNDAIIALHTQGMTNKDIAKELNMPLGEVKLIVDVYKNAK